MKRPERLVILGANLTALAVARSARRWGLEPCVVDIAPGPASKSRMATCAVDASQTRSSLLQQVVRFGKERDSWLVSTADAWTWEIIEHRQHLESVFSKTLQPSNEALAICLSKTAFAAWCTAQAIPSPRQYAVDPRTLEVPEQISFPVFVRPTVTQHADRHPEIAKAREVATPTELHAYLSVFKAAKLGASVSESLLGRNLAQLSVGVAMAGNRSATMVARKIRPLAKACRVGTLVETITDSGAEQLALTAMRRLEYEGIAEVEILKDVETGQMYVIEISARPWIQFALAEAAGRDMLGFFLADGRLDAPAKQAHRVWVDFSGDLWNCFNRDDGLVRQKALSVHEYLKSLLRANVYARWMAGDPGPFLADALAIVHTALRAVRKSRPESSGLTHRRRVSKRAKTYD
jgi:predicted ATP-grasp superfamily ATP-dependent carboligase